MLQSRCARRGRAGDPLPRLQTVQSRKAPHAWDELTSWISPTSISSLSPTTATPEWTLHELETGNRRTGGQAESFTLDALKAVRQRNTRHPRVFGQRPGGRPDRKCPLEGDAAGADPAECGPSRKAVEVVFFAADHGTEKIRGGGI